MVGRADISRGELIFLEGGLIFMEGKSRYLWRVELISLEGKADISEGGG